MANYNLTTKAEEDLTKMYGQGIEQFGLKQARSYFTKLHKRFELLAQNPNLGRIATGLKPSGLRYFPFQAQGIYYMPTEGGILIIRVLAQRMDMLKHF